MARRPWYGRYIGYIYYVLRKRAGTGWDEDMIGLSDSTLHTNNDLNLNTQHRGRATQRLYMCVWYTLTEHVPILHCLLAWHISI